LVRLERSPRLRTPGYLILGLLCLQPLIELLVGGWPPQPGLGAWRLSILSTASGSLLIPLLGLFLIYWLAVLDGDRRMATVVAWIASLGALLCLAAVGEFALDAAETRAQIQPDMATRYGISAGWVIAKFLLGAAAGLVLARSAFRTARMLRRSAPASLVIGERSVDEGTEIPQTPGSKPASPG
jgi:hypothetical protein